MKQQDYTTVWDEYRTINTHTGQQLCRKATAERTVNHCVVLKKNKCSRNIGSKKSLMNKKCLMHLWFQKRGLFKQLQNSLQESVSETSTSCLRERRADIGLFVKDLHFSSYFVLIPLFNDWSDCTTLHYKLLYNKLVGSQLRFCHEVADGIQLT